MDPGVGMEGWLIGLPTALVPLSAGDMQSTCVCSRPPGFSPWFSEVAFGGLGLSVSCPQFDPAVQACGYFQSFLVSLYFVAWGDICPGASTAAKVRGASLSLSGTVQPVRDSWVSLSTGGLRCSGYTRRG